MLNRNFNGRKYCRTYVGGTRNEELKMFLDVQGEKDDNSECDWLQYRRLFIEYFDDKLHVILSWKALVLELSYAALILGAIVLLTQIPILFFVFMGLSLIFRFIGFILKQQQIQNANIYDISLDVILDEINKQTGFNLSKN